MCVCVYVCVRARLWIGMLPPGARVVMACRDLSRAEQAAEEVRQSTGNGNVVIRHLDLASVYSVRQFAKDFLETEDRLDILINNAGQLPCRQLSSATCWRLPTCLSSCISINTKTGSSLNMSINTGDENNYSNNETTY